jgi:uracil-DNA glycosylase
MLPVCILVFWQQGGDTVDQILVTCEQTKKSLKADVLSSGKNTMKVAIVGSNLVLELHRQGKVFEGRAAGLTFESNGVIL